MTENVNIGFQFNSFVLLLTGIHSISVSKKDCILHFSYGFCSETNEKILLCVFFFFSMFNVLLLEYVLMKPDKVCDNDTECNITAVAIS